MTDQQPKYKNIPTEDWVRYPEIKPKESGYYFTVYQDYPDGKDVGNLFYKCIYWCNKREDWISWKSPFRETPHIFKVGCFIEKTRTDFYCSCIEKVEELYLKKMTDPQTFCFDDEMIETALIANGWSRGWDGEMWVHENENPDWSSRSKREAFIKLLYKCNLVSDKDK